MIEVQCTSCHTRYRIDEQVLPEGLPTFKCSRCGHVFTFEPRQWRLDAQSESAALKPSVAAAETSNESFASGARPRQGVERRSSVPDRNAPSELPSSSQDSVAARASNISEPSRAGAAAAGVQPKPGKEEEPARTREQPEPADLETQHSLRDQPDPAETITARQPAPLPQLTAKQPEKFYSRISTGEEPDLVSGENLSFDFADEEPAPDQARLNRRSRGSGPTRQPSRSAPARWEVGDDDSIAAVESSIESGPLGEEMAQVGRRRLRADDPEPRFDDERFVDEEAAPVYNRAITHSARFFVLLIFLIGAGFGALTLLIHSAPSTSSALLSYLPVIGDRFVLPETPAKLVALRDVNGVYQESKEGRKALVISGTAENVGTESLRIVQLSAALRDAQGHSLASQAVYCGNNVSAGMIGQMTPHEIEFFQKLEPAGTFALEPSASCRFVAVFVSPPSAAHTYDVSVSQAVPGTAQTVDDPAS